MTAAVSEAINEETDTLLNINKQEMKITKQNKAIVQLSKIINPKNVATPFPPLNLKNKG